MTATTNMNAPTTGNSQAAQLLSLLNGQATGGQAAGATGASGQSANMAGKAGGGDFAALLQALASGNAAGNGNGAAGVTGAAQASKGAATSISALLSIYNGATKPSGDAANDGDALKMLVSALKKAGIDVSSLSLPAGQSATAATADALLTNGMTNTSGQAPDQDNDGTDNPLLALLALLSSQAQVQPAPAAGSQTSGDQANSAAKAEAAKSADGAANLLLQLNGQTKQTVEDFMASLSPDDRARLGDALRQAQATSANATAQTQSANAEAAANAAQRAATQANAAAAGDRALPQQAPSQAQNAAQSDARAEAAQTQVSNQIQARAAAAAANAGQTTDTNAAARTASQAMSDHLGRDVSLQITRNDRANSMAGGSHLLSAGTSASILAAGQGQNLGQNLGQNPGQNMSQGNAFAEAANAAAQNAQPQSTQPQSTQPQSTQPQGVKPTGGGSAANLFGLATSGDQGIASADPDGDGFSDMLGAVSRPGSVDQLASSVVNISRTPMTQQAAPAQVAMHMTKAAEAGGNRFVIQLSPASLGDVRVDMKVNKDGTVHAMLHVDKPETLQMLQRDAGLLHQALQDAGLKPDSGSLNFSLRQDGGQFAEQNGDGNGASRGGAGGLGEPDTDIADMAAQSSRRSHAGQLDVTI